MTSVALNLPNLIEVPEVPLALSVLDQRGSPLNGAKVRVAFGATRAPLRDTCSGAELTLTSNAEGQILTSVPLLGGRAASSLRLRLLMEYGGETRVVETEALAAQSVTQSAASGDFAMLGARVVWENATAAPVGAPPFVQVSAESLDFDRDGTPDFQETLPAFLEGPAAADLISALELSA